MAEHFRDDGFYTIGYVTNPWLRADLGFDQGFEEYVLIPCFSHRRLGCDGRDLIERAKQSIGARDTRKVFLYLHFMDVHHPYGPTENVPRLFRPEQGSYVYRDGLVPDLAADDLEFTKALYDERIAHVDELLSDLMGFVVRHNLTDRTALVVTSDHGDEFYEHGGLGHGTTLHNELTNSFAILWGPGVFQAQEVDRYLPALDLLPTLLEALRIPPDPGLQGHSQWRSERPDGTTDDRPIVSELGEQKAVILDKWKLIVDLANGREAFYDIDHDGQIETTQSLPAPDRQEQMRRTLASVVEAASQDGAELEAIDPDTLKQLRSLGYLR